MTDASDIQEIPLDYDVSLWFGLSYSSYLVLPRSLMEGMHPAWQHKMVALLEEMRVTYDSDKIEDNYTVRLRGENGKFKSDPLRNYRRPPVLPYRAAPTHPTRRGEG